MADPVNLKSWYIQLADWIEQFIKDNWSGLAVLLYDYEEKKVDAAKQAQANAELKEKLATDENEIRKADALKSADDIIREELGKPRDS